METNLHELFGSNEKNEKEGVWFQLNDKLSFKMKRFGGLNASEVKKAYAKYYKPHARLIEKGLMPEDKEKRIFAKVWISSCLVDWKGVESNGKEIPFSFDTAVDVLSGLPDLLDTLVDVTQDKDEFKEEVGN